MKQISVFDFYTLGLALEPLKAWTFETLFDVVTPDATIAREQLKEAVGRGSFLLPATIDAAKALIGLLEKYFGESADAGFWFGSQTDKLRHSAGLIVTATKDFEFVFRLDSPRMATFAVAKKGIYETCDLIDRAEDHLPKSLASLLPEQAKTDVAASGRCLAFDIPTASVFHMWRALESVFGAYHVTLTGKTFAEAKVQRNWGEYITALGKAGADTKLTGNLDHIRKHYRNPVMHPNENATTDEAFALFGAGFSAITQILQAMATHQTKP